MFNGFLPVKEMLSVPAQLNTPFLFHSFVGVAPVAPQMWHWYKSTAGFQFSHVVDIIYQA